MQESVIQGVSLVGSALILIAFASSQLRKMKPSDLAYILLNLFGSGILALVAIIEQQWGFLLLEVAWALVSLWSLGQTVSGKNVDARH